MRSNASISTRTHRRRCGAANTRFERCKRAIDVIAALIGLVAVLPLLAACAIWIRLRDNGPVLYSQWRVGRDGVLFRIYKLRTMRVDAERDGARWASEHDPRIVPGCHWMRRSHIDELPQLWNILIGDMSLVGPRPERPEMIEQLRMHIPRIDKRFLCTPGLTGLAQLRNGYTNDIVGARRKQLYDLQYLRRRTLKQDLRLMLETISRVWDHAAL